MKEATGGRRALLKGRALFLSPAPFSRDRWVLAGLLLLVVGGMVVSDPIEKRMVLRIVDEQSAQLIWQSEVHAQSGWSHTYLHSVEKCPITERYSINAEGRMVLMESWNCSFGAGIASDAGEGKGRLVDGYYLITDLEKPFEVIYMQAASFSEHTLHIDTYTLHLSDEHADRLLRIETIFVPRWKRW
ncbi:DUF1850 domain-containing protein [Marinicrinis sediminis]|uniref:DUF1850 domain-containing protein n=1 Tax=Marinicrinis sediminis TaxID=1652465 RepID=A0ABW5RA52_9BACL